MNTKDLAEYCFGKLGATMDHPFGPELDVYRVGGKIFALLYEQEDGIANIRLKCDPALADLLRQKHAAVTPGYHMNKLHWNSVHCDGSIDDDEIYGYIDHSHDLIMKSLTKKVREQLSAGDCGSSLQ